MRLIDADDLLDDCVFSSAQFEKAMKEFISDAPTIDAVPVVHGTWVVVHDEVFADSYFCSVCRNEPIVDLYAEYCLSNYCPNCGANMDGGKDDADN